MSGTSARGIQLKLRKKPAGGTDVHVYLRRVREGGIKETRISEKDSEGLFSVVDPLSKMGDSVDLDQLTMNQNPRKWIQRILSDFPKHSKDFAEFLLNDFCDNAQTRMREEEKYAILIVWNKTILLCHTSAGERTITPSLEVIERMVDADNVERYVRFQEQKHGTTVTHYEKTRSKSLALWLGVSEGEIAYWLGGEIRIYCKIAESECIFEFTREDFNDRFLEQKTIGFEGDSLRISERDILPITGIRVGKRLYRTSQEFMQEYMSQYLSLAHYCERYKKINNSLEPQTSTVVDAEDCVKVLGRSPRKLVSKLNKNFAVLYVNEFIRLDRGWRPSILARFQSGTATKFCHAGMDFSPSPFRIGPFEIYNTPSVPEGVLASLRMIHEHMRGGASRTVNSILCYSIFASLSKICNPNPLSCFFAEIAEESLKSIKMESPVIAQRETAVIQYKDGDWISGLDDENIAEKVATKLNAGVPSVLFIGINEDLQTLATVKCNKLRSERLDSMERIVQEKLPALIIRFDKIQVQSDECLLLVTSIPRGEST